MTPNQIVEQVKKDFEKAYSHFQDECKKLRTGRAHPSMIESLMVSAYGVPTPLLQLATITTPEAQQLQISPFDPSNVAKIADNQSAKRDPEVGDATPPLSLPKKPGAWDFSIPRIMDRPRCVLIIAFIPPIQADQAIPFQVDCSMFAKPFVVSHMVLPISMVFVSDHQ